MKVNRHGKAKILSHDEIQILFNEGLHNLRDRVIFAVCLFTHHITSDSGARILRKAFEQTGIDGASSHSMRRTALTQMSNAGIPLRTIQEISGHRNLEQLQQYLEVQPEQVRGAIAALSMLSPVHNARDGKLKFHSITINRSNKKNA
ncbi:tyrosine-type recombinase/integrase [Planktothrix agardhii 1032]|nr:tyrosine-type recombinase/integrase [Planktothrix agardhii 1032]